MYRPMYLQSVIFLLSILSAGAKDAGVCYNAKKEDVGPAGDQDIRPKASMFVGESFVRKNGEKCPCSFVKTNCKIAGKSGMPCSDFVVDGKDAALNGYQNVTIKHQLKLCNFNEGLNVIKLSEPPKQAKVEFFHPIGEGIDQNFLVEKTFNNEELRPGECVSAIDTKTISTSRSKYFMKAILQGAQKKPSGDVVQGAFCYAFGFNKIDFKYDYGLGSCEVRTELKCTVEGGTDCADFIKTLDKTACTRFNATFIANACNDNDRDIQTQLGPSNYKQNTYERNVDGTYKRIKQLLPEEIKSNSCTTVQTKKIVDPCEKNFWQVNLKGKMYNENAENGWVYKDKECESYSFEKLPVLDIEPTKSPTELPTARPTNDPTGIPSKVPTEIPSNEPTAAPTKVPTAGPTKVPTSIPAIS